MIARLLLLLTLLAIPELAAATGGHLRWSTCYGEAGAAIDRGFACDVNTGSDPMVVSYQLAEALPQVVGNEVVIDIQTAGATLPDWWRFRNPGTCRQTSLSVNFVGDDQWVHCVDGWQGLASGAIGAYHVAYGAPTRARIVLVVAVPLENAFAVPAGQETFSMRLVMLRNKTVGPDACSGCTVPACLVLGGLKVVQPFGVGDVQFTAPASELDSYYLTWQGGAVGGPGCPAATPARVPTWGSIKALYR